jgi:hypothetical protein
MVLLYCNYRVMAVNLLGQPLLDLEISSFFQSDFRFIGFIIVFLIRR